MNERRNRLAAVTLFLAVAGAALASAASASAPYQERIPIDQTQTVYACGFPVVRHDTGTLIYYVRDRSGTTVEGAHFVDWQITWTNPANGRSVTSQRAYTEQDTYTADGLDTHFEAGLVALATIPGEGEVAGNTGHLVAVFDAEGNLVEVKVDSGQNSGPVLPYLCAYLGGAS